MARYTPDGLTSLWWVTTIANPSAPTAVEILAGVNLSGFLAAEGFDNGPSTNLVDAAGLADTVDLQAVGTYGFKPKVTLFRDDTTDTALNTLVYRAAGFWVLREKVAVATAIASSQKVDVYPATLQQPMKAAYTKNEMQKFSSEAALTAAPRFAVTVA
jgi:hypothetical protein